MLIAAFTFLALHPLAYALARVERGAAWRSRLLLSAYVVLLCALPFQLPADQLFLRSTAATIAVSYAVKAFELTRGRLRDAGTLQSFPRFLLWLAVPHDPRLPRDPQARALNRARAARRVLRVLGKACAAVGLFFVGRALQHVQLPYLLCTTITAFHFYLAATAITDSFAALALARGCDIDEIFRLPFLARSPSDFWSRRWNLYIARFGARHIYVPLQSLGALPATFAVFAASALMHEYIVIAIFGWSTRGLGYMSAFFMVQCLGVVAQRLWLRVAGNPGRWPHAVATLLHLCWFVPSTGLFFEPVGAMLNGWGLWWQPLPW